MSKLQGVGTALVGLVAPVKTLTKKCVAIGVSPAALRLLHLVLLAAILVGLGYLSKLLFEPGGLLHGYLPNLFEGKYPWLYLPVAFLLFPVASGWVFYLIWCLLSAEESAAPYPEIDDAWSQACQALDRAGIQLADTPIFLVLGRPEAPENFLFADLELTVTQTPASATAPLHVYANRDAIFITCAGACLLAKHAENLGQVRSEKPNQEHADPMAALKADDGTIVPVGQSKDLLDKLRRYGAQGQLRALQKRILRNATGNKTNDILNQASEVERLEGALAHLCELIVRDRRPLCPINGVLLLLPLGATDSDHDANITAGVLKRDLAVTRRVFQLHCPRFAIVCDMESIPGFVEFARLQGKRGSRIGRSFPLASNVTGDALFTALDGAIKNYCLSGMRALVYPQFDVQRNGQSDAVNCNLYLLLDEMRERKDRLADILTRGLRGQEGDPLLFGGCYLAATGTVEAEQAYVKGVLNRLYKEEYHEGQGTQAFVQWTQEAVRANATYETRTGCGYALLLLLTIGGIVGGALYWRLY
jgi:hypothetical protein